MPTPARGFRSSSYASSRSGRSTSGYAQYVTGSCQCKTGESSAIVPSIIFSNRGWLSLDGNRLCQGGMQGGVLASRDISSHTRVHIRLGISPLTTVRRRVIEISALPSSILPVCSFCRVSVPSDVSYASEFIDGISKCLVHCHS